MTAPSTLAPNIITVDGWSCYDYPDSPADDDGNVWIWQTIEGWYGGISPRGNPVARPLLDGSFDGPAPFDGRTVSIAGALVSPTRAALQKGLDRISRVLAGTARRGVLIVDEQVVPITRTLDVRLGGATLVTRDGPVTARWSLDLYAADPTRYGVTSRSITLDPYASGGGRTYNLLFARSYGAFGWSGRGQAANLGDTHTPLLVTFVGPSVNPSLQLVGGSRLALLMTLFDGDTVEIDSGKRTVIYNGSASRRQYLTGDSNWITLPPGMSDLFYSVKSGTGQCIASWRDAWS
jgi:Phage tail protein